jgi:hypothetical protein
LRKNDLRKSFLSIYLSLGETRPGGRDAGRSSRPDQPALDPCSEQGLQVTKAAFECRLFMKNNFFALRSKEACAVEACPKGERRGRRSTSEEPESRQEGMEPEFRNDVAEPEFKREVAEPESGSQDAEQSAPKNDWKVAGRRSTDSSDVGTSALSISKFYKYNR